MQEQYLSIGDWRDLKKNGWTLIYERIDSHRLAQGSTVPPERYGYVGPRDSASSVGVKHVSFTADKI